MRGWRRRRDSGQPGRPGLPCCPARRCPASHCLLDAALGGYKRCSRPGLVMCWLPLKGGQCLGTARAAALASRPLQAIDIGSWQRHNAMQGPPGREGLQQGCPNLRACCSLCVMRSDRVNRWAPSRSGLPRSSNAPGKGHLRWGLPSMRGMQVHPPADGVSRRQRLRESSHSGRGPTNALACMQPRQGPCRSAPSPSRGAAAPPRRWTRPRAHACALRELMPLQGLWVGQTVWHRSRRPVLARGGLQVRGSSGGLPRPPGPTRIPYAAGCPPHACMARMHGSQEHQGSAPRPSLQPHKGVGHGPGGFLWWARAASRMCGGDGPAHVRSTCKTWGRRQLGSP